MKIFYRAWFVWRKKCRARQVREWLSPCLVKTPTQGFRKALYARRREKLNCRNEIHNCPLDKGKERGGRYLVSRSFSPQKKPPDLRFKPLRHGLENKGLPRRGRKKCRKRRQSVKSVRSLRGVGPVGSLLKENVARIFGACNSSAVGSHRHTCLCWKWKQSRIRVKSKKERKGGRERENRKGRQPLKPYLGFLMTKEKAERMEGGGGGARSENLRSRSPQGPTMRWEGWCGSETR